MPRRLVLFSSCSVPMIIKSTWKTWSQLENYQRHALSDRIEVPISCSYWSSSSIFWTVNSSSRSVTKWSRAFDKTVAILISYIHQTTIYQQYCFVGEKATDWTWVLFQDADFTPGGVLCMFGTHAYVPISRVSSEVEQKANSGISGWC